MVVSKYMDNCPHLIPLLAFNMFYHFLAFKKRKPQESKRMKSMGEGFISSQTLVMILP